MAESMDILQERLRKNVMQASELKAKIDINRSIKRGDTSELNTSHGDTLLGQHNLGQKYYDLGKF